MKLVFALCALMLAGCVSEDIRSIGRLVTDAAVGADTGVDADDADVIVDAADDAVIGDASTCPTVLADPVAATDQQIWDCGHIPDGLGRCDIFGCTSCGCTSYVRSEELCGTEFCTGPLGATLPDGAVVEATGCSDSTYYSGPPLNCSGSVIPQSACMLRYLLLNGYCS